MRPDPKPTRRRAGRREWERIYREKVYRKPCRCCGVVPPTSHVSAHHLLGGNRKEDVPELVVPLCGSGTTGCHGVYTSRWPGAGADGVRRGWGEVASAVRASLSDDERAAVVARVGDVGLERLYPRRRPDRPTRPERERSDDAA